MPRSLRLTHAARDDLEEIASWQTQPGSGEAARRRLRAIRLAIRRVRLAPCRYRKIDDSPSRRMLVVERHVVIYTVEPDTGDNATAGDVLVIRVFGPGQVR